jgi:GTP-binding protein HflX
MGNHVLILHPYLKQQLASGDISRTLESSLEEACGLARAISLKIIAAEIVPLSRQTPATYIGKGKVESYQSLIAAEEIEVVVVDTSLSPVQQRNLEKAWKCKVIDRTALILEIFGARAQTKEGKLQVHLAALEYQKSRLVRSWTHLERQRGGGGFMGGPGEKQIESDRRGITEQIERIRKQLKKVVQTRSLHRHSRQKVPYPVVALVGYTNAGKSTLFNYLTHAEVLAKDILFATLDPTMRLVKMPSGQRIILSDTVGFISNLPTELVAAFRATLEEVVEADLMVHVDDIASPEHIENAEDVMLVLKSLVSEERLSNDMITAYNKTDRLEPENQRSLHQKTADQPDKASISAISGDGVNALLAKIDHKLQREHQTQQITLSASDGKTIAWIHANIRVIKEDHDDEAITFDLKLSEKDWGRLQKISGITAT